MRRHSCSLKAGVGLILAALQLPLVAVVEISPDRSEIVVAADATKVVSFAAKELNDILAKSFGKSLPVVAVPTPGKSSVFLGPSAWSREAGISVESLPRDAFVIQSSPGKVFVVGRDNPRCDIERCLKEAGRSGDGERATLFGVYEFLERYAGVRFYFPGELGTIVPAVDKVVVPDGTTTVKPNFTARSVYMSQDGPAPGGTGRLYDKSWKALSWLRLRLQTVAIPCCHGQRGFCFPERFHSSHPEYFALLKKDGKLVRDAAEHCLGDNSQHMCHTSAIWDEVFEDCKAYLSGAKAETRGILRDWQKGEYGWTASFQLPYIDIMPQDGLQPCQCDACQKAYDKSTGQYATELIWGNTAKLARRLKSAGFKNFRLTQMAYPPYRDVPKCKLEPEICVQVAEIGPWACACPEQMESEIDEIRRWSDKLGTKVWMWTYPSKFGRKATPGVPDMAPRAWAKYYKATVPYAFGAFCETEGEKAIFHYLNYYVFAKIAWNPDLDVEALLDEHFRLMFGAAAPEIAEFYDDLERLWTTKVLTRWHKTVDGFDFEVAPMEELWADVYTREVRKKWQRLFDRAAEKTVNDPASSKRVAFVKAEFFDYHCGVFDRANNIDAVRDRYRALDPSKNLFPRMTEPLHLETADPKVMSGKLFPLKGKIKPGTRYRLSGVFRLKNVTPGKNMRGAKGCYFCGYAWRDLWFPKLGPVFTGTADWRFREYEFTTPPEGTPATRDPYFGFVLNRATGEAWIDCLTLEEIQE